MRKIKEEIDALQREIQAHRTLTEEEQQRLLPMLEKLLPECSVPVSVDTYKASTAAAALAAGVHIINDVWGLQYDQGEMAEVAAKYDVPVIVMHNKQQRDYPEGPLNDMHDFFCRSIAIGGEKGIKWDKFILDPGLGFAKDKEDNLAIMKNLEQLQSFGCPILLAASRKRFIGDILGLPAQERVEGTIAASLLGRMKGANSSFSEAVKLADSTVEYLVPEVFWYTVTL